MKRTISLILAIILMVSSMPVQAVAGEKETEAVLFQDDILEAAIISEETTSESIPEYTFSLKAAVEHEVSAADVEPLADASQNGTCGENLTWTFDDGTLAIYGTGEMSDFEVGDGLTATYEIPWEEYLDAITTVIIEEGVTSISNNAFRDCVNLEKIMMPSSVNTMGASINRSGGSVVDGSAFYDCKNITTAGPIGSGCDYEFAWTTEIPDYAFAGLSGLESVMLPQTLTSISRGAFEVSALKSITIPASVKSIKSYAFHRCEIENITFRSKATTISDYAFDRCYYLSDVYFPGTEADWEKFVEENIGTAGRNGIVGNKALLEATVHFDGSSSSMIELQNPYPNFYLFRGDPNIYNMENPEDTSYAKLSEIVKMVGDGSPGDILWTSSDGDVLTVSLTGKLVPDFVGHAAGTVTVIASNAQGESISIPVTVLLPNMLTFETVHDARQFYYEGGFYSEKSGFSNCVEIFLKFENREVEEYPCAFEDPADEGIAISPITLTASVNGDNLSFVQETYQNTYTRTFEPIALKNSLTELLMLFPMNEQELKPGDVYTVDVTMESDSFEEPVTSVHTFTICDAVLTTVGSHIQFVDSSNNTYHVTKANPYSCMAGLKDDPEYKWSKWSSFDFENYYEVVVADLMIGVLNVQQDQEFTQMATTLTTWVNNNTAIIGEINTVLKNDYSDSFSFDESEIDKLFKITKYDLGTNNAEFKKENGLYALLIESFGKPEHQDKLRAVFQKVDDTQQIFKLISVPLDFYKEFQAWGNTITLMNTYHHADKELKRVVETVLEKIPQDADPKLREAIKSYVSYDHDVTGQALEIFDAWLDTAAKVSYDTFKAVWGKSAAQYMGSKLLSFIGDISLKGGSKLAETAIFSTASKAFGAVSTGASIGLFISDLICDSSDKASEMGKVIAVADYAPYFVEALEQYEQMMLERKTLDSVRVFERAFLLHQAAQSYLVEHVYNLLILKGESLVQIIRGNDEYYDVAGEALVYKNKVDNLRCCAPSTMDSGTIRNARHVAIKCPVDVILYDEDGTEIVSIRDNVLEYAAEGITACILDSEKHIIVPSELDFSVRIEATDDGTMDYFISEYGDDLIVDRIVQVENIPLNKNQEFLGELPKQMGTDVPNYSLNSDDQSYVPELGHIWDEGVVTREPSAQAPGIKTFTCTVCKITRTEEIPYEAPVVDGSVQRISGKDRVKTALSVAKALRDTLKVDKFDAVIIATGVNEKFADALAGSYLANRKKAPILLYNKSGLSQLNVNFIKENLKTDGTVYILGGDSAVPTTVEQTLSAYNVVRLSGKTRYETNLAILKEAGISGADEILVATGTNFADSLSASAVGLPLLLVNGKNTAPNAVQTEFLKSVAGKKITIIGGDGAVSEEMKAAIEAVTGVTAERISGKTRHNTSVLIAQKYFPDADFALITYAKNFPDGLAGGPLAYAMGAPLLLTNAGQEAIANEYIAAEGIESGYVLGGDSAVSDETARKVFGLAADAAIEKAYYTE